MHSQSSPWWAITSAVKALGIESHPPRAGRSSCHNLRIGLVSRVVAAEALMPTALALAERLAQGAPIALELVKRLAYRQWLLDLGDPGRLGGEE